MPSTSPFLFLRSSPVRNFSFLSSIHGGRKEAGSTNNRAVRVRSHQHVFPFFLSFFLPFFSSVIDAFDSPLGLDLSIQSNDPWTRFTLVLSLSHPLSLDAIESREKNRANIALTPYLNSNESCESFICHSRSLYLRIYLCRFAMTLVRIKIRSYLAIARYVIITRIIVLYVCIKRVYVCTAQW